jgi:PTH1 family peptidyl-tRNA hydrolase
MTFMNLSGQAVRAVAGYFRVVPSRVMVVVDDADLALGTLRLRPAGSSGGHHGIQSVESGLGTREFPRLRVGIGRRGENDRQIVGHVLGKFTPVESGVVDDVVKRSVEALECWLIAGINLAMNRFNGTVTVPETKEN